VTWIDCNSQHLEAIRCIFNEAIVTSTALYDYQPRSPETMQAWWAAKQAGHYPVIGVLSKTGDLMGFASYGPFRSFPAYKYTVEHSVYVDSRFRGRGLGRQLLERAILAAEAQGYHAMVGVIDADNAVSIALHDSLGFQRCGEMREVGFKFGRWLNLVIYQKLLSSPDAPVDG
jgi:L-amino acid N-acyltransferase YncA